MYAGAYSGIVQGGRGFNFVLSKGAQYPLGPEPP